MAASGGSRFHSRESVIPSAIPVSLYGLEAVLLARSRQRGFASSGYTAAQQRTSRSTTAVASTSRTAADDARTLALSGISISLVRKIRVTAVQR